MLPNLQIIFFFIHFVIKRFKKIFIHYLTLGCIIIHYTTIILNALDKVVDYIELKVVEV